GEYCEYNSGYIFVFFDNNASRAHTSLSLLDALPISDRIVLGTSSHHAVSALKQIYRPLVMRGVPVIVTNHETAEHHQRAVNLLQDRKSTRLNSSHVANSYAVFCLKQKRRIS